MDKMRIEKRKRVLQDIKTICIDSKRNKVSLYDLDTDQNSPLCVNGTYSKPQLIDVIKYLNQECPQTHTNTHTNTNTHTHTPSLMKLNKPHLITLANKLLNGILSDIAVNPTYEESEKALVGVVSKSEPAVTSNSSINISIKSGPVNPVAGPVGITVIKDTSSVANAAIADHASKVQSLTPTQKRLYANLLHVNGLSKEELIDAILDADTHTVDEDTILMNIVLKRDQLECANRAVEVDEEQFNKEMDMVILMSEEERSHIQNRKRKRVDEIRNDCRVDLLRTADEFKSSILLGNYTHGNSRSSSSSSSSSNSDNSSDSRCCKIILEAIKKLNAARCTSMPCTCNVENSTLRLSVATLLLLEFDSQKFWRESSTCYLERMRERIQSAYNKDMILNTYATLPIDVVDNKRLYDILAVEITQLQKILYCLPTVGGAIPKAFRLADKSYINSCNQSMKATLDDDGFQILQQSDNNDDSEDDDDDNAVYDDDDDDDDDE